MGLHAPDLHLRSIGKHCMQRKFSIRSILFWIHLGVGLTAGIVVLFLSLTGALLAFERPLLAASDARAMGGLHPTATPMPLHLLLARVEEAAGQKATSISVPADPAAPVTVEAGRGRVYLANPYDGIVVGPASAGMRAFFEQVTVLHRWFGLSGASRRTVVVVKGWFTLGFLFLIVSGWVLWLPAKFTPQALRVRLRPGWATTARAREYNWHHSFGLWASVPLAAIALTGVIMALPWANELLFRATGSPLPQQRMQGGPREEHGAAGHEGGKRHGAAGERGEGERSEGPHKAERPQTTDYDGIFATARQEAGALHPAWRTLQMRAPEPGAHTVQVVVDAGNGAQPARRDTLVLTAEGRLDHVERFADQSAGRKARAVVRFLHTGKIFGLAGELIGFLACLAGAALVYTGVALSVRRFAR
jgi:uncharacterized iron-regulated membrane protein